MTTRNKLYFASDFHLGAPNYASSREREIRIVRWLEEIKSDAAEIYFVGDIFDFWFEYKTVVPRGFMRFFGKLAELADAGVKLYFFKGNHDMWMFDYLERELGVIIISDELKFDRNGKKFYLHHGDGLGPGDSKYKFLKGFFRSGLCQWLFARLHPNFGMGIAISWSLKSRLVNSRKEHGKKGEQEWLMTFCREQLQSEHFDYMIFGHRHIPLDIQLNEKSRYINLGEWIYYDYSYAVFDGEELTMRYQLRAPQPPKEEV